MSNPNTIPWLHYQDLQIPDLELRSQFNQFISSGKYSEAISLLKTKEEQTKGKAFISDAINKIVNGLIALETDFNTNANVFLSDLALRYNDIINNLDYKEEWNASIKYHAYNFVDYNNNIYMALDEVPVGSVPQDNIYWVELNILGQQGAPGTNISLQYEWSNYRQYEVNDLVTYNNNLYIAKVANSGQYPTASETYWFPFLTIDKGAIEIGVYPPTNPIQNTVWFKTDSDYSYSYGPIAGQFKRYTSSGTWEDMNLHTKFSWVEDVADYGSIVNTSNINIYSSNWTYDYYSGNYNYIYYNNHITYSSRIDVFINGNVSNEQLSFYSSLGITYTNGSISLTTSKSPSVNLPLTIKIQ